MNADIRLLKKLYVKSKVSKIGDSCKCPSCFSVFIKKTRQQAFCRNMGSVCKDNYWNNVTETKRNNTTRISPANKRYYEENIKNRPIVDDDQGWDAHKGSF